MYYIIPHYYFYCFFCYIRLKRVRTLERKENIDILDQNNPLLSPSETIPLTEKDSNPADVLANTEIDSSVKTFKSPRVKPKDTTEVKFTKDTLSFDDFVGSITDIRSAKVYSGGIAASTLSNAVRKYKKTPSPANREAVEALYNRYVK